MMYPRSGTLSKVRDSLPLKYRRYFPKVWGDVIAMVFALGAIHAIGIFELFVVLPYIDEKGSNAYWIHTVMGIYIYINVMTCFAKTIATDATSGSVVLPSVLKPGWRFCAACEANSPPRSFHCWACNVCILRRDHHCVFTGNCIGHANQRFFVTMLLYLWIAASYCTFLNIDYTWEVLGGFNWKSIFSMVMPLLSWMFGLSVAFNFTVSFISSTCMIGFFLLGTLFAYNIMNIMNAQTVHERAVRTKEYDIGWQGNMETALGKKWYIALLSPWISSPLTSDGITFKKRGSRESVKDI